MRGAGCTALHERDGCARLGAKRKAFLAREAGMYGQSNTFPKTCESVDEWLKAIGMVRSLTCDCLPARPPFACFLPMLCFPPPGAGPYPLPHTNAKG